MFTIRLHNLQFFSFHGLYEEERILGNNFEVNAEVTVKATETVVNLEQTVDYVKILQYHKAADEYPNCSFRNGGTGFGFKDLSY